MAVEPTSPTTRLLTLLNVSAARSTKRKRHEDNPLPTTKLNKRRSLEPASDPGNSNEETTGATNVDDEGDEVEEDKTIEAEDLKDDGAPHNLSGRLQTHVAQKTRQIPMSIILGPSPPL